MILESVQVSIAKFFILKIRIHKIQGLFLLYAEKMFKHC